MSQRDLGLPQQGRNAKIAGSDPVVRVRLEYRSGSGRHKIKRQRRNWEVRRGGGGGGARALEAESHQEQLKDLAYPWPETEKQR